MRDGNRVCPICDKTMNNIDFHWLLISECRACDAYYFAFKELWIWLEHMPPPADVCDKIIRGDSQMSHDWIIYRCPECEQDMAERQYSYDSGYFIDICTKCKWVYIKKERLEEIKTYAFSLDHSKEWRWMRLAWESIGKWIMDAYLNDNTNKTGEADQNYDRASAVSSLFTHMFNKFTK